MIASLFSRDGDLRTKFFRIETCIASDLQSGVMSVYANAASPNSFTLPLIKEGHLLGYLLAVARYGV